MAVNPKAGTTNTLDAAASQLEGLMGDDVAEEVVEAEAPDEVELTEADDEVEIVEDDAELEVEEDEDTSPIETVASLAEAMGMSTEDVLESLKATVKVDGHSEEVSLAELTAGYQKDRDYRQKTERLNREREAFEQQQQQVVQQLQADHAQAAYVLNSLERGLTEEMNSPELQQLRKTNENAYVARRMDFQDRLQTLQKLKQQAAQEYSRTQQMLAEQQRQAISSQLEKESEALQSAIPGWNSEKQSKLYDWLANEYGYSDEQLDQVYDHRIVRMAWEAMQYRAQQAQSEVTKKRVKQAPKLIKPTAPPSKAKLDAKNARRLRGRLKESGKLQDAAALIEQSIL